MSVVTPLPVGREPAVVGLMGDMNGSAFLVDDVAATDELLLSPVASTSMPGFFALAHFAGFERLELFKGESDAVPAGAGANVTFAWLFALHLLRYLKGADVLPGLPMAKDSSNRVNIEGGSSNRLRSSPSHGHHLPVFHPSIVLHAPTDDIHGALPPEPLDLGMKLFERNDPGLANILL